MAALAVIGGVDDRLRLGGTVSHEEHGLGTVACITTAGRITVQFHESGMTKVWRLHELNVVSCCLPGDFTALFSGSCVIC